MAHIENICPDFFAFWERAQGRNRPDQIDLWRSLYEDRHRDIFEVYYGAFGQRERLEQALDRFPQAVPSMRAALASAEESMGRVIPRCAHLFEAPEADIRSVLMVGLFQSDAWATSLRGRPTSFLTLEHVTDPRWLEITVAHETAHTLHHLCTSPPLADWVDGGTVGEGLFTEGLAVYASARVVSGATDLAYLNKQGPAGAAWLEACTSQWDMLRRQVLHDVTRTDMAGRQTYFYNRKDVSPTGIPARAGYFVGYHAVRVLGQEHTVAAMARWTAGRVLTETRQVLEHLDQLPTEQPPTSG